MKGKLYPPPLSLCLQVKGKRILPENEPPTGLLRTVYDNLGRCKIKQLDAFRDCCETSIYACMEPKFRRKCTWHMCVQGLVKGERLPGLVDGRVALFGSVACLVL